MSKNLAVDRRADRPAALRVDRLVEAPKEPGETSAIEITHSGLSQLEAGKLDDSLGIICDDAYARQALSPLVVLKELPALDHWVRHIGPDLPEDLWDGLKRAVATTLDHQSQEATDCRWLRVVVMLASGRLHRGRLLPQVTPRR